MSFDKAGLLAAHAEPTYFFILGDWPGQHAPTR